MTKWRLWEHTVGRGERRFVKPHIGHRVETEWLGKAYTSLCTPAGRAWYGVDKGPITIKAILQRGDMCRRCIRIAGLEGRRVKGMAIIKVDMTGSADDREWPVLEDGIYPGKVENIVSENSRAGKPMLTWTCKADEL